MAQFAWEGVTRTGQTLKGEMEAPNAEAVIAQLRRQGIQPGNVKERGKGMGIKIPGFGGQKVTTKDLVVFTRQFATMIDAGLPLVQCLDILGKQQENKAFQKMLIKVKEDVESGSTFADALKKHPKAFDELYVNLVAAGEIGGILDTILNRLAAYIEKAMKLKKKVKSAMTYPTTIIGIAVVVISVILIFVIPAFEKMFKDFGGELPAATKVVILLSNLIQRYILVAIGGFFIGSAVYKRYYKTPAGRLQMDALFLKMPIAGPLIRKVAVAKFSRTLGTMISSGVPILDGLDIVAKTAGNKVVDRKSTRLNSSYRL